MRSSLQLTPDQAKLLIVCIGVAGLFIWLLALSLWLFFRPRERGLSLTQVITGKTAEEVRNLLPKAAALQEPMWELIGGDKQHAVFHLSSPWKTDLHVEVAAHQQGCQLTVRQVKGGDRDAQGTPADVGNQPGGWLGSIMRIWLIVEPMAIVGLGVFLWVAVAEHPQARIRGQSLQMMQIMHVLWPPFLFWGLQKTMTRGLRQRMQRFLTMVELL